VGHFSKFIKQIQSGIFRMALPTGRRELKQSKGLLQGGMLHASMESLGNFPQGPTDLFALATGS
jgi:hypothetical protein